MCLGHMRPSLLKECQVFASSSFGQRGAAEAQSHLIFTVFDDGQVEELAAVLLGQDGVDPGSVGPC